MARGKRGGGGAVAHGIDDEARWLFANMHGRACEYACGLGRCLVLIVTVIVTVSVSAHGA